MPNVAEIMAVLRLDSAGFDRGIAAARGEMTATAGSAEKMTGAVDLTQRAVIATGRAAGMTAAQYARYKAALLTASAAQAKFTAVTNDATASVRENQLAEAALIRANERLRLSSPAAAMTANAAAAKKSAAGMAEAGAAAETMGGRIRGGVETLGKLGLAFGAFELARKAIEFVTAGKDLTDALNGVQAASRASAGQMRAVRAQAIGLGQDLTVPGATAVDAADAILDLVKAGIKLPKAMLAARPALLLASATNTDMTDTARVLGDTLDLFSLSGDQAAHTADLLAASTFGASHDLLGLFDELKQAGPTAQALGISLDDTITALTLLAKHGISASVGGAGLKTMLTNLTKEAPKSTAALQDLNVTAFDTQGKFVGFPKLFGQLHAAQERFGPDSKRFVGDLNAAFGVRSQTVAALFAKEGTKAYEEVAAALKSGDLQKYANLMNRGVGAGFRQLNKEATAVGIGIYTKFEPALASAVDYLGRQLPKAVSAASSFLAPMASFIGGALSAAWHGFAAAAGLAMDALAPIGHLVGALNRPIGAVAVAVLSMWTAFKAYQIGVAALGAVRFAVASLGATFSNGLSSLSAYGRSMAATFSGNATESELAAAIMEKDFADTAAAALASAAGTADAAATKAEAYATMRAASEESSQAEILAADEAAAAARAAAVSAAESAATAAGAAEAAGVVIADAGATASVGWRGVAGPIAIAAIGVLALVSMFHKSTGASKEAAAAAKAYTEALSSGGGKSAVVDSVIKQLSDANVPETIGKLNKALGSTQFTGKQFVDAIRQGGPALDNLKAHLQSVITLGTTAAKSVTYGKNSVYAPAKETAAAKAATIALANLNAERDGMSKAAAKEITNFKAFGVVAAPIDKVATSLHLTSAAAVQYAGMLGLAVTKNNNLIDPSKANQAAIASVGKAFDNATASGSEFLGAMQQFSTSQGTAADRATLMAATLKAANGDMLSYSGAMAGAYDATRALGDSITQAASTAFPKLIKAHGGVQLATSKYLHGLINMKTGTINYTKAGAGPLISSMQGIQTAAMAAASATYQHTKRTLGGKAAADAAYKVYVAQTKPGLIDEFEKMGLNATQAGRVAKAYLDTPKSVKTTLEAEGANPIVDILTRIGKLLANFTGQPWDATVNVLTADAQAKIAALTAKIAAAKQGNVPTIDVNTAAGQLKLEALITARNNLQDKTITITVDTVKTGAVYNSQVPKAPPKKPKASGGKLDGPGTGISDSIPINASKGEFISTAKSTDRNERALSAGNAGATLAVVHGSSHGHAGAHRGPSHTYAGGGAVVQSFARGGKVTGSAIYNVGNGYGFQGQYYAKLKDAKAAQSDYRHGQAAAARYDDGSKAKDAASAGASAISGITPVQAAPEKSSTRSFLDTFNAAGRATTAVYKSGPQNYSKYVKMVGELNKALAHAQAQLSNLRVKINGSDMKALKNSLKGTADDVRAAFSAMMADAKNAGLSKSAASLATKREGWLIKSVNYRNKLQAQLGAPTDNSTTAYQRLETATANRDNEKATVSGAVKGMFNISSAGSNSPSGKVTFGSMRAEQLQAKTTIVKWAAGLKKLMPHFKKSKAGMSYLQSLAEAGPASYPQVAALLSGGATGIKQMVTTEQQIDSVADDIGKAVGTTVFGQSVTDAATAVKKLQDLIKNQNAGIAALDDKIAAGIKASLSNMMFTIDAKGIAKLVDTGNKQNGRH